MSFSYYATPLDLELQGAPSPSLVRVRNARVYQLQVASTKADDYLRGRYTPPYVAQVGTVQPVLVDASTATGTMSVALTTGATVFPLQAYGIIAQVLTTGALGVATGRMSQDGGITYGSSFVISSTPIVLSWGVTVTFSDPGVGGFYVGDQYQCSVSYGSLTSHVVAIATYGLLRTRGVAPDGNAYDPIRDAYKEAIRWFESVRDLKTDPGLTDSSGGTGQDVFIEVPVDGDQSGLEPDRGWQSVLGRGNYTDQANPWPGSWTP